MQPHLLITGRPGSGKSTLARWLAQGFGGEWAGYETIQTGSCSGGPLFSLRAVPGTELGPISRQQGEGRPVPVPETFDQLGTACIRRAIEGPQPVILLDEIGRFEAGSPRFLEAVQQAAVSPKVFLAVVKKEPLPHLKALEELHRQVGGIRVDLDEISPAKARQQLAEALWPQKALHWGLTLRLYGLEKRFGPGPMRLLQGVQRTGSLHRAAEEMGMAYSKAWKLMNTLEQEWGFPLLQRQTGGAGGGRSVLTEKGSELLRRYEAMLGAVEAAAETAFFEHFGGQKPFL